MSKGKKLFTRQLTLKLTEEQWEKLTVLVSKLDFSTNLQSVIRKMIDLFKPEGK
jgi:hypothetical protein